nr:mannonate dehydratase [Maliibacterium massiliense]
MQMTFRWFGTGFDSVSLAQIRQVPGVTGIISTLYDKPPGALWEKSEIAALKSTVEQAGLALVGIESVNIADDIKAALRARDEMIENYIRTLEHLGQCGIRLVCYNFMPVFDWTRSDLAKLRADGSTVMSYDQARIDAIDPEAMFVRMDAGSGGFLLPGWEPERMARIRELFALYQGVDAAALRANLAYFLKAIMPTCARYGIRMAIHPDDPAWPVFGLPRIATCKEDLLAIMDMVDSPYNGVTLCTGSLGSNPNNDIVDVIGALKGRIAFAHIRNIRHLGPGRFDEAAHLSSDGSLDMYAILRALYEAGFDGPMRPDHGRAVWGEVSMPGYGLYDRAMGAAYLQGLWEAIAKQNK